jgi:hypothetical protein
MEITEERNEFFINKNKFISYKQFNKTKLHGISLTISITSEKIDYYYLDIYYQNRIMFQVSSKNEKFKNIYYKYHFGENHSLFHFIFDNNSLMFENPDYEEFYVLIYLEKVFILHRIFNPNLFIQSFSVKHKNDFEQIDLDSSSEKIIDIEPFFRQENNWIDEFTNYNWSYFKPIESNQLNYLKICFLEMKRFCFSEFQSLF